MAAFAVAPEIGKLSKLQFLSLSLEQFNESAVFAFASQLRNLKQLEEIHLLSSNSVDLILGYFFPRLVKLKNLKRVGLNFYSISNEDKEDIKAQFKKIRPDIQVSFD